RQLRAVPLGELVVTRDPRDLVFEAAIAAGARAFVGVEECLHRVGVRERRPVGDRGGEGDLARAVVRDLDGRNVRTTDSVVAARVGERARVERLRGLPRG